MKKVIVREGLIFGIWLGVSLFISIRGGDRVEMHVHHFYPELFFMYFKPCIYMFIIIRAGVLAIQILRKNGMLQISKEK